MLIAFDLEIAKIIDDDNPDWSPPLGISCAATANLKLDGSYGYAVWKGIPGRMTRKQCRRMVRELMRWTDNNNTLVTFNGLGFDFRVLAEESNLYDECTELAINRHIDIMFQWVCMKGWRVGLDKMCATMGVKGKLKQVTLKSGKVLTGMSGRLAPALWAEYEYKAVEDYLKDDVRSTLDLANLINKRGGMRYVSSTGKAHDVWGELKTVKQCLKMPEVNTGWMSDPVSRASYYDWTSVL